MLILPLYSVMALFQLKDGTIRKMILIQEPKPITGAQIAIIVTVIVLFILSIIGCCVFFNRDKICKSETTSDSDQSTAKSDEPQFTNGQADPGMPLMPVQQQNVPDGVQPPPAGQVRHQCSGGYLMFWGIGKVLVRRFIICF